MTDIRELVFGTLGMLVRRWRGLAALEVILRPISIALLTPLTAALLSGLLARSAGIGTISNTQLLSFATSRPGVIALLLIPVVTIAVAYFEQSCALWLLSGPHVGVKVSLIAVAARLPRLTALAVLQLATVIAVVLPFLAAGGAVYWLLLSDADINFYLTRRPPKFFVAAVLGVALAIAATFLLLRLMVRWFVAVPILLTESASPRAALRLSTERCGGRFRLVLSAIALWLGARFVGAALAGAGLSLLANSMFSGSRDTIADALRSTIVLLLIDAAVLTAAAIVDGSLHAAVVRCVYLKTSPASQPAPTVERPVARGLRWRWVLGAAAVVVVAAGAHAWRSASKLMAHQDVTVTAHRAGAAHAPENSLAALRLAIDAGADAAEIDVQLSADGTLFVMHDRDLRRIAGLPLVVSQATDEQLGEADIGRLHDPAFAGERLATLEQFIDLARGRIQLSIELKYYGAEPRLAERVVDLLHETKFSDQATVISLEYAALQQMRRLDPQIRLGYLVSASLGDVTKVDAEFVSVIQSKITPQLLARAAAAGHGVAAWTVNRPADMTRLMLAGVNDLVTDEPRLAVEAAQEYERLSDAELLILRVRQVLER